MTQQATTGLLGLVLILGLSACGRPNPSVPAGTASYSVQSNMAAPRPPHQTSQAPQPRPRHRPRRHPPHVQPGETIFIGGIPVPTGTIFARPPHTHDLDLARLKRQQMPPVEAAPPRQAKEEIARGARAAKEQMAQQQAWDDEHLRRLEPTIRLELIKTTENIVDLEARLEWTTEELAKTLLELELESERKKAAALRRMLVKGVYSK